MINTICCDSKNFRDFSVTFTLCLQIWLYQTIVGNASNKRGELLYDNIGFLNYFYMMKYLELSCNSLDL